MGRTFQIAETFRSLTVVENVQMALLSADRRILHWWRLAAAHRRADALALLERWACTPRPTAPAAPWLMAM